MKAGTNLIRVYTGEQITGIHLKSELEKNGISVLLKDCFSSGLSAGFVAGIPLTIDLYIQEVDLEKANPILGDFNALNN